MKLKSRSEFMRMEVLTGRFIPAPYIESSDWFPVLMNQSGLYQISDMDQGSSGRVLSVKEVHYWCNHTMIW